MADDLVPGGIFEAGDAYYVGPGHTPILYAGTEVIEFSPTQELEQTSRSSRRNGRERLTA